MPDFRGDYPIKSNQVTWMRAYSCLNLEKTDLSLAPVDSDLNLPTTVGTRSPDRARTVRAASSTWNCAWPNSEITLWVNLPGLTFPGGFFP